MQNANRIDNESIQLLTAEGAAEVQRLRARETADTIAAVKLLNRNELEAGASQKQFQFRMDRSTRRSVVDVLDRETGEVLYQIPPEAAIRQAAEIRRGAREGACEERIVDGF